LIPRVGVKKKDQNSPTLFIVRKGPKVFGENVPKARRKRKPAPQRGISLNPTWERGLIPQKEERAHPLGGKDWGSIRMGGFPNSINLKMANRSRRTGRKPGVIVKAIGGKKRT